MHKTPRTSVLNTSLGTQENQMKVEVQLLSDKGRAVAGAQRHSLRRYTGAFTLRETRSATLSRTLLVANLHSVSDASSEPLLPPLHDALVIHAEGGRLRVRGFELLDGTQLGQTWDVRVLPC